MKRHSGAERISKDGLKSITQGSRSRVSHGNSGAVGAAKLEIVEHKSSRTLKAAAPLVCSQT